MENVSKVNDSHDESTRSALPDPLVDPSYDSRKLSRLYFDRSLVYEGLGAAVWFGEMDAAIQMLMAAAAWGERIPGSLPPDDRSLARIVCGGDMDKWLSIKGRALAGWVLCSNSRLYHPEVAEAVNTSMAQYRQRVNAARRSVEARKTKPATRVKKQQRNERSNARSTNAETNAVMSCHVPSRHSSQDKEHSRDSSFDGNGIMDGAPSNKDYRRVDTNKADAPPATARRKLGGMGAVDQALDELHGAGMDAWSLAA